MLLPRGNGDVACKVVNIDGVEARCLNLSNAPSGGVFPLSFEEAIDRLNELERMFIELDGSFVWISDANGRESQIDGVLTDLNNAVINIELKGFDYSCVDSLLMIFGWPDLSIVIHDIRRGLFFEEEDYRRFHRQLRRE